MYYPQIYQGSSDISEPNNNGAHIDFGKSGGGQFAAEGLRADNEETLEMRDRILEWMWEDYQTYLWDQWRGGRGGGGIGVQI